MIETVTVITRGFDGEQRKRWQAKLLARKGTLLVLKGVFDREIDHPHLGLIRRSTISHEYYWLDRWYNVFRFHEPDGAFRNYYCNISMPPTYENGVLDYVDLDIDILVAKDGTYSILDSDEFEENAAKHGFSDDLRTKVSESVDELIMMIGLRQFPFDQ